MSDEVESNPASSLQADNIFDQPEGTDWLLAFAIGFANSMGIEIGVTVITGGSMISGTLIGGRKYIEELGVLLADADPASLRSQMAKSFDMFSNVYPVADGSLPLLSNKASYLHLRSARLTDAGGNVLPREGTLLRLKTADISGFFIGALNAS